MLTLLAIFFFALLALGVVVVLLDTDSSKDFIYQGLTEANSLARDRYGFMDVKRNLIISFAMLGIVAAVGFVALAIKSTEALGIAALMMLVPIGLRGWAYFDNKAAAKRGRARQIEFLTRLKEHLSFEKPEVETVTLFNGMTAKTVSNRTYYPLFGWVYSDKPELHEALFEIQSQLCEIARKPESQWFPK
jgi:hypothetical protein